MGLGSAPNDFNFCGLDLPDHRTGDSKPQLIPEERGQLSTSPSGWGYLNL